MNVLPLMIKRILFSLALAAIAAGSLSSGDTEHRDRLSVHYDGRNLTAEVESLPDGDYIPSEWLSEAFAGDVERGKGGFVLSFRFEGATFRFEDRIPFFSFEDRPYQLVHTPLVRGGDFLIPLQFFTEYLPYFFPDLLSFDSESFSLSDGRFDNVIRGIKRSAKRGETVVFLHSSSPPTYEVDASRPGVLILDIFKTRFSHDLVDSLSGFGCIDSARIVETGTTSRFQFFLGPSARRYRIAETRKPPGISIVFSGDEGKAKKTGSKDRDMVSGINNPKEFMIHTVVIDPGHGGKDPGAIGWNGLREKDINLKVSLEVGNLLKERTDLKVIMTRKKDIYVSLGDRTKKANRSHADLFVSIHCNSSRKKELQGFEAYFLSAAKTDHERAVAFRENLSVRFDEPSVDSTSLDDLQSIFWDLAQNEDLRESSEWAEIMCEEFADGSNIISRGVRQAGFFVLKDAYMPSVLLELGYLSNPVEAKLLGSHDYRKDLAERIYRGIMNYIDRYHKKIGG